MALADDFDQTRQLLYQVSGPPEAPVLVYLPGIHGDWTPTWRIRQLLAGPFRFVEVAYPRAPEWTLDDHVAHLEALLDELGLARVHLLAESFGSLVGWAFALRHPERVDSLILAGGFCLSPGRLRVTAARLMLRLTPAALFERMIDGYYRYLIRHRLDPQALPREAFFPVARTRRGWLASRNRLRIIHQTDLRPRLAALRLPILYLGGSRDWVVPVRREIRTLQRQLHPQCSFRGVLLPGAPHAIIPACYRDVARLITDWVHEQERCPR